MPRRKNSHESVRLTLSVSVQVRNRLESLVEATDAESMTEVIRRSLAVYEGLIKLRDDEGMEFIGRTHDGEEFPFILL